jgi:hemoglobin
VERLIEQFYALVLGDPELEPFFRSTSIGKLRRMQRTFFAAALGGDVEYSGRPIAHAHHGLGIKASHLARFIAHLRKTLEGFDLTERDQQDIIDRINTYADEIVGGGGLDG